MGLIIWFTGLVLGGFIIGLLARILVKGPPRQRFWQTVGFGWGGWLLGSIAVTLVFHGYTPWLVKFAIEVGAAAALIALTSRRRAPTSRL